MSIGQVLTAMVTPFDSKENIDFQKTTQLVDYLIQNGTDGLVVTGTTGESPTLTTEEKTALYRHVVKVTDGKVPVFAGTGTNNTRASIELTKKAEEAGVDGIMIVTPYYSKPSQEGLYQHFKAIAESTALPIMMYNIPGRSVVNMSVDTIVRLSKIDNIVAVKEASGNLDQMSEVIRLTDDQFLLLSGDDALTLPIMSIGGDGVVSVAAHVIGNEMKEMVTSFRNGDVQKAAEWHRNLLPVMREIMSAPSPAGVKTALQLKGLDVGSVRLPLLPLKENERSSLQDIMNSLS